MPIIDPFEEGKNAEPDIIDPFERKTEPQVRTWEEMKGVLTLNTKPEEQRRSRNAMAISATHDIPIDAAYDIEPNVTKALNKPNLFEYSGRSVVAGVGDMYVTLGNIFKWAKIPTAGMADTWINNGKKMQNMYIPPDDKPFEWDDLLDPVFYATKVSRSVPSTLALIPAALVGAELGIAGGTIYAGRALGAFTKTVLGSMGAATLSRPLESAMEASGTYQQAIDNGLSEDEARIAANETFRGNMTLVGLDAIEFLGAFMPLKLNTNLLALRILSTMGRAGGVGAIEGAEERYQQVIQNMAMNPEAKISDFFDFDDPELNEANAIGAIFGAGLGGAGSVYNSLTDRVVKGFTPELKEMFDTRHLEWKESGLTSEEARKKALDEIAATKEGEASIKETIEDLKERAQDITSKAETKPVVEPPITEEPTTEAENITEEDINEFVDIQTAGEGEIVEPEAVITEEPATHVMPSGEVMPGAEHKPQQAPPAVPEIEERPAVPTETSLIKKYVEETGEKVETEADIQKVKDKYPEEYAKIEEENALRQDLWNKLPEDFRANRGINEYTTPELQEIVAKLPKEFKITTPATEGVKTIKGRIRQTTGQVTLSKLIREDKALRHAFGMIAQNARIAFREGKLEGVAAEKVKMRNLLNRAKKMKGVQELFKLTYNDMKKISRKNPLLMSQYEFKLSLDDVRQKAFELAENKNAKMALKELIDRKELKKVENLQRAMKYPPISQMTTEQANEFFDILNKYQQGDVFFSEERIAAVDRVTELKGARTWREAREAMAKELKIPIAELSKIVPSQFDRFRYDSALMQRNPYYHMVVTETHRKFINAEMRTYDIEKDFFKLVKASEKSRPFSLINQFIPQNKLIVEYSESPAEFKNAYAKNMTTAELDVAHYMEQYFSGRALKYLIEHEYLAEEGGLENYYTHVRQGFLEAVKEQGLLEAGKAVFKHYQEDLAVFNIRDGKTGDILPFDKFFKFAMHRSGELLPTYNITKAFMTYVSIFEKMVAFNEIIAKLDTYTQAITPQKLTRRGLEMDKRLKNFLNEYINNKKGSHIDQFIGKQGGTVDMGLRGIITFTRTLDLGGNIAVGVTAGVGETISNLIAMGARNMAKGYARMVTPHGKAIIKKYGAWLGHSPWENFTAPGKGILKKFHEGLFIAFQESSRIANIDYLLGTITDEEFNTETISDERLAELRLEVGRFKVVPHVKSLKGSTTLGSAFMQYKTWAMPHLSTITKDLSTFAKDLTSKPLGETLTTKQARELYRIVGFTSTVVILLAVLHGEDEDNDDSFVGSVIRKAYREMMTLLSALDPSVWSPIRSLGFIYELLRHLRELVFLETYKSRKGLKSLEGLKKQLEPKAIKQFIPKEEELRSNTKRLKWKE